MPIVLGGCMPDSDVRIKHTFFQDWFGIISATSLMGLGVILLKTAHIATGGVAGTSLLLSYVTGLPVGMWFTLVNLPFFIFGYFFMGWEFTVKTVVANLLVMLMTMGAPHVITISSINPVFAAVFGGIAIGIGILGQARHGTGSGGIGIVALYLQREKGINAGRTILSTDVLILGSSFFVFDIYHVGLSILSAICISSMLLTFHKPGLYTGY